MTLEDEAPLVFDQGGRAQGRTQNQLTFCQIDFEPFSRLKPKLFPKLLGNEDPAKAVYLQLMRHFAILVVLLANFSCLASFWTCSYANAPNSQWKPCPPTRRAAVLPEAISDRQPAWL